MSTLRPLHELVHNVSDAFNPASASTTQFLLYSFEAHDLGKKPVMVAESEMKSGKKIVCAGDVLFAKLNPRIPRAWLVANGENGVTKLCSTEFVVLRSNNAREFDPEYLAWTLLAPQFLAPIQAQVSSSTKSHQRVRPDFILDQRIPFRPHNEQRRVVGRIKESLSRVEEMQRLREEAEADAEALRFASVCQVIGDLRKEHRCVSVGEAVGGDRTAMRSGPFGSAMKHHEFVRDGNLVIGIANVQENWFDPIRKWMITDDKYEEMKRYKVAPGDVLVTIMGTIGRSCVVPDALGKAITSKHVYRIRLPETKIEPRYVSYIINFDAEARAQLFGAATGGVMPGLNGTKLRELRFPLPTLKVQRSAVSRLDRIHATISEMTALNRGSDTSVLRESILREAFEGNL